MHPEKTPLSFGDFRLESGELFGGEARIRLQEKPLQVLLLLAERAGQLVTRDELRHRLWAADTYVDFDRNLNTAVKKLRIALRDSADAPRYIETIPKRGYRLIMPVRLAAPCQPPVETPAAAVEPLSAVTLVPESPSVAGGARNRWAAWRSVAARGIAAVLLGLVATSAGDARLAAARANALRKCSEAVTVAVLPFQHEGRGAPHSLSAVLTEGVPQRLVNASGAHLRVFAGRSVQEYSCGKKDFRTMGRELGVRYVVEGSVRRTRDGMRVTAQLFETEHGSLIVAESVDVSADEVAIAQDHIADKVASAVLRCVAPAQRASL